MTFGFSEVLLAYEWGGDQRKFGRLGLVLLDLLRGAEGAFEWGGDDGVDLDGGEVLACCFRLLFEDIRERGFSRKSAS